MLWETQDEIKLYSFKDGNSHKLYNILKGTNFEHLYISKDDLINETKRNKKFDENDVIIDDTELKSQKKIL